MAIEEIRGCRNTYSGNTTTMGGNTTTMSKYGVNRGVKDCKIKSLNIGKSN